MALVRSALGRGLRRATVVGIALAAAGCTVGEGEGYVLSEGLFVPDCWGGPFDLQPDFFASVPFRDTQQIRIQHGSDQQEVSDGLAIQVNATTAVREQLLGQAIPVGLAPELWEEISPGAAVGEPPIVNMALYLQFSCHNQNVVLYATEGSIVFSSLFSGDPNESTGSEKLTEAAFDVTVGDPRDAPPGSTVIPDDRASHLYGYVRFHFQRGQPGQPFP